MNKRVKTNRIQWVNTNAQPEDIPTYQEWDGVKVLSICAVLDRLFGKNNFKVPYNYRLDWETRSKILMDWCEKNSVSYYAAPREEFFVSHGVDLALMDHNAFVVVEDLS